METSELMTYGIDYASGMKNCMNNEAFYKKILAMFMDDRCFPQAQVACASDNQKELFSRMHELKGVSGNAALTGLYAACVPLVELLRYGDADTETVRQLFAAVETEYNKACQGIRIFIGKN